MCLTLYVSSGTASMDTAPWPLTYPPTSSGHLLTHQPAQSISNQRKINDRGLSPLRPADSALPHSSPACRLHKYPSGIPAVRGRVMTRPRQTPSPPAHPPEPAGAGAQVIPTARCPGPSGLQERRAFMPNTRPRSSLNGFLFSAPEKAGRRGLSFPFLPKSIGKATRSSPVVCWDV